MDFQDKIAVITGGASGIGLGTAKALLAKGARVVLADVEKDVAEREADALGEKAEAAELDVRSLASFNTLADRLWKKHGRVDVFINNAGVGAGAEPVMDMREEDMDWVIDVNLKGVWRGCATFGKRMSQQDTPSILCNIGSENSVGFAAPNTGVYTATKYGVVGMSEHLRREAPEQMTICVAFPGLVHTNIGNSRRNGPGDTPPELAARIKAFMAQGMSPEEVGSLLVAGLERGEFFIPLHAHVIKFAETYWQELSQAYASHAPYTKDSEKYNVVTLMQKARTQTKD